MSALLRAFGVICPTAFGLDFRLVGRLHRRGPLHANKPLMCANGFYMGGDTVNAAYISGLNERAYMRLLASLIRPGDAIYNVGANLGYLALWLATRFSRRGGVTVVGFEPDPRTAQRMAGNVMLNPGLNIKTESIALGDIDHTAVLYSAGIGDGSASLTPRSFHANLQEVPVQVVRLDTYQRAAPQFPNWLILDVEGFAGNVMAGAIETLSACRPKIAAEIHSPDERSYVERVLLPLGYVATYELDSMWGTHVVWLPESRNSPC